MKRKALFSVVLTVILCGSATASGQYFIIADYDLEAMAGYDGGYWGIERGKVFLTGDESEIQYLDQHGIRYQSIEYPGELSRLFLCYPDNATPGSEISDVIFDGSNFLIADSRPESDISYRVLRRRSYLFTRPPAGDELILTYDPVIDEMIGQVDGDGIYNMLGRLSGAFPIEIDGRQDTIHTRYSGTPDNSLAAEYILQILESYGYQTEFHGFYGGAIRHMCSYDENRAWVVTENSEALRTTDGGGNWIVMPDGVSASLWGVANWGADQVWITGDGGNIRFSDDGGANFSPQNSGVSSFLFGVDFISENEGWIAGDGGLVLHTSNGGQNWESQSTPTSSRLYDICFVDSQNGWACGRNGVVIHTTSGGESWAMQTANTNQRLYGIDFIDSDNGWVVGWGGVVRHTTNGGANWQTVSLGTNVEKYHVEFVNSSFGCIVGWNGEIFITTDGGTNWEQEISGTQSDFYGVTFVDDQVGFAGGDGVLKKTTDGGQTWFSQVSNIESSWRNVIATKPGTTDPDQQVIICGHMDDRSQTPETNAPGADDNGSGTIAVIEAARIFAERNFEKTIKFCLWTGEEQGLLGSAVYAEEAYARGDDIVGVFNFDMIAWDGNGDASAEFHTGTGNSSIALGNLLNEVVSDYNITLDPDIITFGATGASDHASFWDYGYPAMLGIEDYSSDFNPYYHSTGDNLDHIMIDFFTEYTKGAVGAAATLAVPDTSATSIVDSGALPGGYALRSNYPNPFNAATTIEYSVPRKTEIDLAVYDILGRRVKTLYSGWVEAGGNRVTWNAGNQPSGIYFYRLTGADVSATGRMTLLK